jgi:hypothetical protein
MVVGSAKNRYVVVHPWSGDEVTWNPLDPRDLPTPDCAYIGGIIRVMERDPNIDGLTFYLTNNVDLLPSYGDDVVAIVLGDEWCRIPRYARAVRCVFKTYGTSLTANWAALAHPTPYELAALAQDIRTLAGRLPYLAAAAAAYLRATVRRSRRRARIYDIPLGYYRQVPLPFVPIDERLHDVYFAGSVANRSSRLALLQRLTPKSLSREQMLHHVGKIAVRHPQLAVSTSIISGFAQTTEDAAVHYSRTMMETKICLVPRGTSLETYRFFEGLRAGCIVIAERLPPRRYYQGAPALRIRGWSELDRLVPALLADGDRCARLSRASLDWWDKHCSEDAVGAFVAARIAGDPSVRDPVHRRSGRLRKNPRSPDRPQTFPRNEH